MADLTPMAQAILRAWTQESGRMIKPNPCPSELAEAFDQLTEEGFCSRTEHRSLGYRAVEIDGRVKVIEDREVGTAEVHTLTEAGIEAAAELRPKLWKTIATMADIKLADTRTPIDPGGMSAEET